MNTNTKNLWILTEERPKKRVLEMILSHFAREQNCGFIGGTLQIIPQLNPDSKCFDFTYEVIGFSCAKVNKVYLRTVSGTSSFVDFLVFYQNEMPQEGDEPIYAIEETKTDDKESRNTGVYQRGSKFVYIRHYYPNTRLVMLYSLQIEQKERPTETYIFGTRLLLTLGVTILGKKLDPNIFTPFDNLSDLIVFKANMHRPNKTNIPILITQDTQSISISGRLVKADSLAHDPNIGALSLIAASIRQLGYTQDISIVSHGLEQKHLSSRNKFVFICHLLRVNIRGLLMPQIAPRGLYWHYDTKGEKLATIFLHLTVESFTRGYSIFENHAGCEKGYFMSSQGKAIPLAKYTNRQEYKDGDKSKIIHIPDLVLLDVAEKEVITIEGKKYENMLQGIQELNNYDAFDEMYLRLHYPSFKVVRSVVLFGGEEEQVLRVEVGFLLNNKGKLVLGIKAPKLFTEAIRNLLDYWA